ncbi:predicted protein [Sclerotinia sclerotiorum 1980 UF-70]|uniref:Uncharacterized protein n=2 Tax=Sclerotinia sclerotiorum (strain ATCC 18683 / 1980 / Ss-1) TaxID=665079 RepID=A7F299_SCLS1|nr:predicted protein [Sclerotinia sclerotiorum 1980 UF-70]APA09270.1 hypothetical protein sscle_05g040400 [Sclerotinia sclerotiorum 1980 UF-70]EDN95841.1 predicted protein [Sclerotinia sclerotiorum 1980 UF-70]
MKWPSNNQEFSRRFPGDLLTIHDLSDKDRHASGSAWSASHLQRFRVLVRDHIDNVPILERYRERAVKAVADNEVMLRSLQLFSYQQLPTLSHAELRVEPGFGAFYEAIADVIRLGDVHPQEVHLRRPRRQIKAPERPGFRSGEGEGLSSPLRESTPPPASGTDPTTPTPIRRTLLTGFSPLIPSTSTSNLCIRRHLL